MKLMLSLLILASSSAFAAEATPPQTPPPPATSIYNFMVDTIDGKKVDLSIYQGKTVMIVNVASKCGYTPQYEGLEALYKKYRDQGFVILGFPSNDFMSQEPGTNAEIKHFCQAKYNVDFPMFSKNPVKGDAKQPLYRFLVQNAPPGKTGEVGWNFEKFLIGPTGKVLGRFGSSVKPQSPEIQAAIEKNLPPHKM